MVKHSTHLNSPVGGGGGRIDDGIDCRSFRGERRLGKVLDMVWFGGRLPPLYFRSSTAAMVWGGAHRGGGAVALLVCLSGI